MNGYGAKFRMKKHPLPKMDRERKALYFAMEARKAKFMREKEQRPEVRRAAYQRQLEMEYV